MKSLNSQIIKKIMNQLFKFLIVSGVGWIIDFTVFIVITEALGLSVRYSNMISSIPAVTFVFFLSIKKIFGKKSKISLSNKYFIYFTYQIIIVSLVSMLGEKLYLLFLNSSGFTHEFIAKHIKLYTKICITPITVMCNFVFMKFLAEKL